MAGVNRRAFLGRAILGGTGWLVLREARSAWSYQANEKLNLAVVGLGARGSYHVDMVPRVGQTLAAVCDANRTRIAAALKKYPQTPAFQDFRTMLDELDRRLDGVIVATPDHTHAVIAASAMTRGKHVYCEKPIAHDVGEARDLRQLARKHKVATQMGNQGMATDAFRCTLERIQDGAVGEIREAHVWYVFGGSGPMTRPADTPPVPEHVNWDLWLGPAPLRPYHPTYMNSWWAWREYSTGCLGGGGSHSINMTFKALDLAALWEGRAKGAIRVEPDSPERCPENFPRVEIVRFHVPARGSMPPAVVHWYNATEDELRRRGIWQRLEKIAGRPLDWKEGWTPQSGSLLVGSKGVVHTNAHNSLCALLPEKDFPKTGGKPQRFPSVRSHEREWMQACQGGPKALSNFDHSGPAIEFVLAGNIATLVGRPVLFDPGQFKILNDPEADRALRPEHRKGWELPG
ncbi:MAG: Gfo/Idh/MocA family oxidoreductase [Thermoguttaceae bacterium]|jgi:predicted dehydrogenase|nr:Gfo/Idh/MocA family oxidoreductase [Thermoguttaceae bacterium]